MRKLLSLSAIILLCCSAFVLPEPPEKVIVGKWKVSDSSLASAVQATVNFIKQNNPDQADAIEEQTAALGLMISSLVYEYKADNSYEVTTPQGIQKGKWSIGSNGKHLIVERANGNKRVDSIVSLSATRMILINGERKDTTLFVRP